MRATGVGKCVALLAVGAAVAWHAAATFLWVSPDSPLKDAAAPTLTSYFRPYFGQSWQMFAPDPANADVVTDVQFGTTTGSAGGWQRTGEYARDTGRHQLVPRDRGGWSPRRRALDSDHAHLSADEAKQVGHDLAAYPDLTTPPAGGVPSASLVEYYRAEQGMTALLSTWGCAGDTASAPGGPGPITRVRLRTTVSGTTPLDASAGPTPVVTTTGWRPLPAVSADACASAPWSTRART